MPLCKEAACQAHDASKARCTQMSTVLCKGVSSSLRTDHVNGMLGMRITHRREAAAEAGPRRLNFPVAPPLLLGFQFHSACCVEGGL